VKLSLERKIAFGFIIALAVLLLVTTVAWRMVDRFQSTQDWVNHTREVLSRLEQTLSEVLSMQASTRGFVLTGDEGVLAPFHTGSVRGSELLAELRDLLMDNPAQQIRLAKLEPAVARARNVMVGRIADRRARGLEAATETAAYMEGQRSVDEIRRLVREMIADERQLLDHRLDQARRLGHLTIAAIAGATLAASGLVVLAWMRVRRDLKHRRDAEWALQESLARLEDIYNNAPCGYHSLDPAGRIIAMNDTALRWLGYDRSAVVGKMKFSEILTVESAARFERNFSDFKRTGAAANVDYDWQRRDGTVLPVLLNATAIYDPDGRYVASRATVFDVTARRRVEAERDRIFTLSRDLICIAGFDGYFKRVNPIWEPTLGYTVAELTARPFFDFIHPDDHENCRHELRGLGEGRETIGFETRFRCRDGSFRWFRWNARAVPSEGLIYASAQDITDRRAADEQIRWLNADLQMRALQLEAANQELESFSYSVSHDLRAPLRHIDGFANLLTKRANDVLDAEGRRYLGVISRAAKQMGTLIDDLLAFSRIGRTALRLEPVDQNRLVAEVIADGRYESAARPIRWEIGTLPPVQADAAMLRQVWRNLIDNAVKYSSKAEAPHITIGSAPPTADGEVVFFVRDNGVGFDMAYAEKLFGVFQRLHGPSDFEGTGIGLANVRRIVSRHGGRTWAEGRVNEGATFYFSFPSPAASSAPLAASA
jgi:PAS domain S-box-containing protein